MRGISSSPWKSGAPSCTRSSSARGAPGVSRLSKYGDAVGEEITTWPAFRLATAIADKQVGSRELLEAYLGRIERLNPALNAVVTLDADRALAAARTADEETAR